MGPRMGEPVEGGQKSSVNHPSPTKIEGDFVQKPSVQGVVKIAKSLGVQVEDLLK